MPQQRRADLPELQLAFLDQQARTGLAWQRVAAQVRPRPLRGIVTLPEEAQALIVVVSSSRLDGTSSLLAALERDLRDASLAAAMFEELLPTPAHSDPLSFFDTNVMAAQLLAVTDALAEEPLLGALPFGLFAIGGAAAAAVIAATQRPAKVNALVLVNAELTAASESLPELAAPALSLLPRADDNGFLAASSGRGIREVRGLPTRSITSERMRMVAHRASGWFQRHLLRSATC